jgi:hypothetical protein
MPRQSRKAAWSEIAGHVTKPKRGRKSKVTGLTEDEQAIQDKYKHLVVIAGSLLAPGKHPDFPGKRSLLLRCECGKEHRRATQDCFQVRCCPACKKESKKKVKKDGAA